MAIYLIYDKDKVQQFETHSTKNGAKARVESLLAEGLTLDDIKIINGTLVNPIPVDVVKTVTI